MLKHSIVLVVVVTSLRQHGTCAFLPQEIQPTVSYRFTHISSDTKLFATPIEKKGPFLNVGLATKLALNQALVGSTILTSGSGLQLLEKVANFGDIRSFLLGITGVIPLLLFSKQIEESEAPAVANLNLSTNMVVLRLFGDSPQPITALIVSLVLSSLTGVVEETIFRGKMFPILSQWSIDNLGVADGIPYGFLLSTLIFAALHVNPKSFFVGGEAIADAFVLLSYQIVTGSIFCALYLFTFNLAVPIIAHSLYDFYSFYAVHLKVTSQMEYAEQEALMPVGKNLAVEAKWSMERGEEFVQSSKKTFYLMDTNRDGLISRKELRVALYSYGIRLSEMESEVITNQADTDSSGEIDFDEFLEFIGPKGDTSKAIKTSLLGIQ